MFKLALVLVFSLPTLAFANAPSNTVPTSELTVDYQYMPSGPTDPNGIFLIDMTKVVVANGQVTSEPLDQSADDVVTFSNGTETLVFNPASEQNTLPVVLGGTYTASFKRFNGETYTSSVVMPAAVTVTAPTANQVFSKTNPVNIAWNAVPSQAALFAVITNCAAMNLGGISFNAAYTAATVPAGAASACPSTVQMQFLPVYMNSGTGFGGFSAGSVGGVQFSYGATEQPQAISLKGLRLRNLMSQTLQNANHLVVIK